MRSTLVITLILLVAAFAVAQQEPTSPSAPAGQSQTQSQPGNPAGQASPGSPSAMAPMGSDMIEGCLGGSNPNYTVTDKAGTTYQLDIPKGADASVLAKHIGESVQVQGSLDNPGSAASSSTSASGSTSSASTSPSSTAGTHSIHVARIGKGSSSCPGSSSTTPKPPSK